MHSSLGAGHVRLAGLNNAVVFHERNRAARYTRFGPTRQSTARWGGSRLETYYANVFFIQELRVPGSDRPCRDIANKFSFRRVFARATSAVSEGEEKTGRGKCHLFGIPECKLP